MMCEFCRIIRRDAPAEILFEDEHSIAILDIRPIHLGHILVLPKYHCETFTDVPSEALSPLIRTTQLVCRALLESVRPDGFNIFSNNGVAAGQSVFHFHFHVTPRYHDDNIRFVLQLKNYKDGEMTEYGNRIRAAIASHH